MFLRKSFFFESAHICKDLQKPCRSAQIRQDRKPGCMYHFLEKTLIDLGRTQRSRVRDPASAGNFFVHFQNWTGLKGPPFNFFWQCETFFEKFLCIQRVKLFQFFFDFCNKLQFPKAQSVFRFTFFGTMRLFQSSHFSSEIRSFQCIPKIMFVNTIRNFDVLS